MIRILQSIKEDILKGCLLISGLSFVISVFITIITVDLTSSLSLILEEIIKSTSSLGFLFGCIIILLGLVLAFFKPPSHSSSTQIGKKFVPRYHSDSISKESKKLNTPPSSSSSSMFGPRELKLVFSGLLAIIVAISIWITYLFIQILVP